MTDATPPATILVVDDNDANRALARATLEDEGFTVVLATNGAEALEAFERSRPDCVVLDVRMPGMDGFEACRRLRAMPGGPETPILFFTALRDVDTFDEARAAGGDDFLTKPVRPTELLVRVQSALKLRRMSMELREHFAAFRAQRDDLLRLQLQKERLTAFLVHDLKNPVNVMDLHAQVLQRDKALPEAARSSAAKIRGEARHLNRMILNLLDLSKGEEGRLVPQRAEMQLEALVKSVLEELAVNAQSRDLELRAEVQAEKLFADADLLRRALTNLVENALRYAPAHSVVTVRATERDSGVELRVEDQGQGVPAEVRERVFDPFVQLDGKGGPNRAGRGLGLAFCRLAVLAHDGRIWIEDGAPGAHFCLWLPQ